MRGLLSPCPRRISELPTASARAPRRSLCARRLPWFYSDDDDDDPIGNLGLDSDEPVGPPASDEEVLKATYEWVDAVIVHMKVCPFSSSTFKAGMPIGTVGYPLSRATTSEELYQVP